DGLPNGACFHERSGWLCCATTRCGGPAACIHTSQQLQPGVEGGQLRAAGDRSGGMGSRLRQHGADSMKPAMSPAAFEAAIREIGRERYHDKHPFHKLLHGGKLTKAQVQAWALNRFCYQAAVPRKDAALISRTDDRELRREWL